jgi:hypothetical protein
VDPYQLKMNLRYLGSLDDCILGCLTFSTALKNELIQGVPELAPQRKKGALGRILKKKSPISNDNREKTFWS